MRKHTMLAAAVAAAISLAGCEQAKDDAAVDAAPAEPAVDLAAEADAIRARSGEWMNYANAKDAASTANKMYTADAVMIADEKAYKGPAAIQASLEANSKESPDGVVSWTSDDIRVAASGDMAVEIGAFTYDPDGDGKKPAIQGTFVTTWVKSDGEWRALTDAGGQNADTATP